MSKLSIVIITLTALAPTLAVSTLVHATASCTPTSSNRPVCPSQAPLDKASFIDPTVKIRSPKRVSLGQQVFVGPFADLVARLDNDDDDEDDNKPSADILIGASSNVQDHVKIDAHWNHRRSASDNNKVKALFSGIKHQGVDIGERVVLAHRVTVKGQAQLGVQKSSAVPAGCPVTQPEALMFVSFGAEVDGAIIEKNAQIGALARVGPGVRLKSGTAVSAGKNITKQSEATIGSTDSKVVCFTEANAEFANTVIEANEELAKGYSELAQTDINHVKGVSVNPTTELSAEYTPHFNSTGPNTGTEMTDPKFRNRIIGRVFLENTKDSLNSTNRMGNKISLRGDEGKEIFIGKIGHMHDNVIFHALEKNQDIAEDTLTVGDNVIYGDGAIVHGGLAVTPNTNDEALPATKVGDNVILGRNSVVFRATIGDGAIIGDKSLIFNSDIAPEQVILPRTIVANNVITLDAVEW
jgi:carbonic anhydrase/acetyltransferase-like protein (isoleucine patch superfamily)